MIKSSHLVMGAVALGLCLGAGPVQAGDKAGEAGIRALEHHFAEAVMAKDVDAIMKLYAPGDELLVFDVIPPRQYAGAKAYRDDWVQFFAGYKGPVKVEISDLVVEASGSLGWSHSIQHAIGTDTGGQPSDLTVRVTDVYHKVGGRWRIVHEHVSIPVDLATDKGDMASKP
jgi:ketosteroid isomerase-like protein